MNRVNRAKCANDMSHAPWLNSDGVMILIIAVNRILFMDVHVLFVSLVLSKYYCVWNEADIAVRKKKEKCKEET